jgi:hypothetical protein
VTAGVLVGLLVAALGVALVTASLGAGLIAAGVALAGWLLLVVDAAPEPEPTERRRP